MDHLHNWLALASVGLRGQRYRKLSEQMSLAELVSLPASTLQQIGLTQRQAHGLSYEAQVWVEQALAWQAEATDHHLICFDHQYYPPLLKETRQPPLVLFIKGDPTLLALPQIAMVGSRLPTPTGRKVARQLAAELTQNGMIVTSGMAQGIDSECHLGALHAGGKTLAVLGHGLRQIYPTSNKRLAADIAQTGALISEYFPDVRARAEYFPQRNRIVVGLSIGTLVVEATIKSGSLISANLAAEYNREVFAVPGSFYNTQASGCHHLIQQGAKLVTGIADILEERALFADNGMKGNNEINLTLDLCTQQLLDNVEDIPISVDVLAERVGMTVTDVSIILLELELLGKIAVVPGGYIKVGST
ncbi:DNA-processing protein DprA [Alishewanella tabrizica]|uniref:DNA protecting protein DprA n=1 Tax=Alishewanella tabrizica TaxID=671278 RepID=A0ABQ2WQK1_9ALTE|nr:DNA-processing protein DprA [Alishewanella tabrizica]GGW65751.1 DNA protecting protein DprA [Alishewanella tabrizica]